MKNNKKLEEKIDEEIFNFHIRGCEPSNEKLTNVCDTRKQAFKQFLRKQVFDNIKFHIQKFYEINPICEKCGNTDLGFSPDGEYYFCSKKINNSLKNGVCGYKYKWDTHILKKISEWFNAEN